MKTDAIQVDLVSTACCQVDGKPVAVASRFKFTVNTAVDIELATCIYVAIEVVDSAEV